MTTESRGAAEPGLLPLAARSAAGGLLMGLANLVPGISGGTMLLAAGIYPRFIQAVAEVTTLRLRLRSLLVLGMVIAAGFLGILFLAGVVKDLVVHQRWVMYSLFVGLTLGGVPVVWRLGRPPTRALWVGAGAGWAAMALLALAQQAGVGAAGGGDSNFVLLVLAGVAGASAMILPGVSGGYLLLLLGQYVPILGGIAAVQTALSAGNLAAAVDPALRVMLPVALGIAVGIVAVSNLLRWLLKRYEKATLGVLLGLLLGAVVGLWPYQRPVTPVVGVTVVKGQVVTEQSLPHIAVEDLPTEYFRPSPGQLGAGLALVLAGAAATALVSRLGREG